MKRPKTAIQRRGFLKKLGLSTVPLFLPTIATSKSPRATSVKANTAQPSPDDFIDFRFDSRFFAPGEYLQKLAKIDELMPIEPDIYGNGGATKALENAFAKLTGKEKAIFVPSGTMANQLAIKLLNQDNTKVIVPENSHIFRDEADAAQAVHNKRLIPVGKGKAFFNVQDLKEAIDYYKSGEVFKSGLGTIALEHPIRRADGAAMPLDTIKEIAGYCKEQGYKLHLDGARLHIAAAYTGVSIKTYAQYFDTVYISLYKYLNASGGAILCGDAALIDKMGHQIKIYGGAVFRTWNQSAMALHYLNGIDQRWKKAVQAGDQLTAALNKMDAFKVSKIAYGTNIYSLKLDKKINPTMFRSVLFDKHKIITHRGANPDKTLSFTINESILSRAVEETIMAFKKGAVEAKV